MTTVNETPLHKDIVRGAKAIAELLYGDAGARRKVFHIVETGRGPFFRIGSTICVRKTELMKWIMEMEENSKKGRKTPTQKKRAESDPDE